MCLALILCRGHATLFLSLQCCCLSSVHMRQWCWILGAPLAAGPHGHALLRPHFYVKFLFHTQQRRLQPSVSPVCAAYTQLYVACILGTPQAEGPLSSSVVHISLKNPFKGVQQHQHHINCRANMNYSKDAHDAPCSNNTHIGIHNVTDSKYTHAGFITFKSFPIPGEGVVTGITWINANDRLARHHFSHAI